jgi:uncharacterized protein YlxW (UPF0749 family)
MLPGAAARSTLLWQVLLAVLLMALGFLLALQFRAGRALSGQEEVPTRNVYALATMLRQERDARRNLEAQVTQLSRRLAEFETAAAQRRSATEALARQLVSLRTAAGLVPLTGPGIAVSVDDGKTAEAGQSPPVVQYVDLVSVVNELWAAGAEAVAVSGNRVAATTGFSQVGGTITADQRRLSPPYVVTAIGDPEALEGAMTIRGGVVEGLRALGLRINVTRGAQVTIPAVKTVPVLRVARPAVP